MNPEEVDAIGESHAKIFSGDVQYSEDMIPGVSTTCRKCGEKSFHKWGTYGLGFETARLEPWLRKRERIRQYQQEYKRRLKEKVQ